MSLQNRQLKKEFKEKKHFEFSDIKSLIGLIGPGKFFVPVTCNLADVLQATNVLIQD